MDAPEHRAARSLRGRLSFGVLSPVQAYLKFQLNVTESEIDSLSLTAHATKMVSLVRGHAHHSSRFGCSRGRSGTPPRGRVRPGGGHGGTGGGLSLGRRSSPAEAALYPFAADADAFFQVDEEGRLKAARALADVMHCQAFSLKSVR